MQYSLIGKTNKQTNNNTNKKHQQKTQHTHHNEVKKCPNWACYRVTKKESHSCGKAAGHGDAKEKSSEEQSKHAVTHWASSFPLEKICNKY